jgi:thiol-disulfide isomerase/thioredoxin
MLKLTHSMATAFVRCFLRAAFAAGLLAFGVLGHAQTKLEPRPELPNGAVVELQGKTLDQKDLDLKQLRGKVVLVMVWRTDCALCRDQMRELRDNTKGWANKPFTTVLVSADANAADVLAYNSFIQTLVPGNERLRQMWARAPAFADNLGIKALSQENRRRSELPLFFIVDQDGKLVAKHSGRMTPEAWESIAFML